ncbi:5-oxoprolinase subunit PxpB [Kitasatospora sp. NBC_00458]|uniref:5-oxoprolinase subunit PxpB n=1 Tax=Kitasatospora sp. NBC_00458 TaxID=2903568 RepID=UPI003FA58631
MTPAAPAAGGGGGGGGTGRPGGGTGGGDAGPTGTGGGDGGGGGEGVALLPVGDRAVLAELADQAAATALYGWLRERQAAGELPEVEEIVPAARTVLLDGVTDVPALTALLHSARPTTADTVPGPLVEVPTVYDGQDLAEVAALWGVSPEAAVRIHCEPEYVVAFCGFAPGFGYLTGLPPRYAVPRRATPRSSVPAGSVALAGPYTGVYPRSSPGGWQLLGHTALPLWDAAREPAALLAPGVRVRFTPLRSGPRRPDADAGGPGTADAARVAGRTGTRPDDTRDTDPASDTGSQSGTERLARAGEADSACRPGSANATDAAGSADGPNPASTGNRAVDRAAADHLDGAHPAGDAGTADAPGTAGRADGRTGGGTGGRTGPGAAGPPNAAGGGSAASRRGGPDGPDAVGGTGRSGGIGGAAGVAGVAGAIDAPAGRPGGAA